MSRLSVCLIGFLLAASMLTGANADYLRIGLFNGSTGDVLDITDLCKQVFGFTPTDVIPVNAWDDSVIDGYVGFDTESLSMSYCDATTLDTVPIEDFVSDLFGFQPMRLSVIHRFGQFDELVAWDYDRIVLLSLDDFSTQDVTMEFAGALCVSGFCFSDFSNLDDGTLAYDGENWYLGFGYITDFVNGLLGAEVVRLTPCNVCGSAADDAIIFTFRAENSPPVAEFNVSPSTGDSSTMFQFDASDSWDAEDEMDNLKVRWDFDSDGSYDTELSFDKAAYHRFSSPGEKEVTLLVMDTEGATGTRTNAVIVGNARPTAAFTVAPESGAVDTVFLFDASQSSDYEDAAEELEVRWDFDSDGVFETEFTRDKTAAYQYDRPRLYTATLQVLDTFGDVGQTTGDVLVQNASPGACFTITPQEGTVLTEFELDASCSSDLEDGLDALQVRWDWDNDAEFDTEFSLEKITHCVFGEVGTHTVGLEVLDSSGGRAVTIRTLRVNNTPPHAAFLAQPQEGTVRTAFSFNATLSYDLEDPTPELQVRWDFDSDGEYETELTTLKTASRNFTTPGQKIITLEVADTLDSRSTTTRTVTVVNTAPTACFLFTPTAGDTNTEFAFDASCSTDWESTAGTLEFRWDFEDDGVFDTLFSNQPKVSHKYATPGQKTVAVEVRDEQGYTDQTRDSFEVEQGNLPPTACFTIEPQSGTTETAFEFDASCSSDADSAGPAQLQVRWDFEGDGVFDTQFSYSKVAYFTYSTAGYKSPIVEVKDPEGATDTADQRIFVEEKNTPPDACFTVTPSTGSTATEFSFNASCSTDPDGTFATLQFRWDFENDGNYDTSYLTSPTVSHRFTTPGTKTVVLEVKDSAGDTDTAQRDIEVESENEPPVACFTVNPVAGDTATDFSFNASCSTDPDGSAATLQVRWDWENDGTFDTSFTTTKTATHRYTTAGTKTIKLQVRDAQGATDQTTWTIDVDEGNVPPTGCFTVTPSAGTTETDFLFDASCSTDPDGSAATLQVRWDWDNDGTFDTSYTTTKTATHRFSEPGQPTIVVQVLDEGGATGRYAKKITVGSSGNNPPVAYFTVTPETGTAATVFFLDASGSFDEDEATTSTLQVQWDFDGDGAFDTSYSTEKATTHSFADPGTYDIMLRVKDPQGATDTYTRRVYVY
ncbi:MAG: PKD domain-containing protein [Candidatus Coatesbacteria bacterium]|nr:PKD domain-containing protein [Candidatus Coatesbacteria bacterium]